MDHTQFLGWAAALAAAAAAGFRSERIMRRNRGTDSVVSGRRSGGERSLSPLALLLVLVPASCTNSADDAPAHTHAGHEHHPCGTPYEPDLRDATMTGEPIRIDTNEGDPDDPSDDQWDLALPQEMLAWLAEQQWVQSHGDWHSIRRWDQTCGPGGAGGPGGPAGPEFVCETAEMLEARGLWRPEIQEREPGDGYAFLVMHRHMIRGFKEAFPRHADMVSGFNKVPLTQDDPENPLTWVDVQWSGDQRATIEILQDIENNLDLFEGEDDFGKWVQFGDGALGAPGGPGGPGGPPGGGGTGGGGGGTGGGDGGAGGGGGGADDSGRPPGGIHGPLHGQWAVPGSPYSLINDNVNLNLVAFWRLHGWIDNVWERYRAAKGIGEDDATFNAEMNAQCEEMHALSEAAPPDDETSTETGAFAEKVAPIFNTYCAGCHAAAGASKGLVLAGMAPSKIRERLVGVTSTEVDMPLVDPGSASTSWLMRKVTGDFSGISCTECSTTMPPAGAKPTDEEIETIRAWIESGATAD